MKNDSCSINGSKTLNALAGAVGGGILGGLIYLVTRTNPVPLTEDELEICSEMKLKSSRFGRLKATPLYKQTRREVGDYLDFLQRTNLNQEERVIHLARKNLNQPYKLHVTGEGDYETYDPGPLYSLRYTDCVVFVEHILAMALSDSWRNFFWMLQKIRYKDGQIGILTRNHYTIADWDVNNSWLVRDISSEIAGDKVKTLNEIVRRQEFFKKFGIMVDWPPEEVQSKYIPRNVVPDVLDKLQGADLVHIIKKNEFHYCSHVGFVMKSDTGRTHFLHASQSAGKVVEESLLGYLNKSQDCVGIKFLRLNENPSPPIPSFNG